MNRHLFILVMIVSVAGLPMARAELVNGCETQINCSVSVSKPPGLVGGTGGSGNITTTTTTTPGSEYSSMGDAGMGVYSQAQQAHGQSMAMAMAGMALAAMGLPQCGNPFGGQAACALGMLGLAAAGMGLASAGQAAGLMEEIGGMPGANGTTGSTTDTSVVGGGTDLTQSAQELKKLEAEYAKHGYKSDGHGNVTTPNGTSLNGNPTQQSLMAAGMSASEANKVLAGLEDMRRKAGQGGVDGSVAGGAGAGGGTGDGDQWGAATGANKASVEVASHDPSRDPASWTGFSKQFGDSLIGVAQSDIFLLIENRVQRERKTMGH